MRQGFFLARRATRQHPNLDATEDRVGQVLKTGPINRKRQRHSKALEGVPVGEGQWRLSLGPPAPLRPLRLTPSSSGRTLNLTLIRENSTAKTRRTPR